MVIETNEEEPPTNEKKTWWQKYKEDVLIWTSLGSFVISLFQFFIMMIKCFKK